MCEIQCKDLKLFDAHSFAFVFGVALMYTLVQYLDGEARCNTHIRLEHAVILPK